jgi:hypothetical protein
MTRYSTTITFFICALAWSQQTEPAADLCTMQGRVVDSITGEPLRKVRLVLRNIGGSGKPA